MSQAKNGHTVKVNYTGRLSDGRVFDTNENRQPLQFVLGENRLISGFEQAILGMSPGDSKTVQVPAEEAYGPRRDEMVLTIDRAQFSEGVEPEVGQSLQLKQTDGSSFGATVTHVTESAITVDANHPLAGQALTFEIVLLEIA
jgi:FKBP-type peptidyl-prolyl cis-trans isomerase 2